MSDFEKNISFSSLLIKICNENLIGADFAETAVSALSIFSNKYCKISDSIENIKPCFPAPTTFCSLRKSSEVKLGYSRANKVKSRISLKVAKLYVKMKLWETDF